MNFRRVTTAVVVAVDAMGWKGRSSQWTDLASDMKNFLFEDFPDWVPDRRRPVGPGWMDGRMVDGWMDGWMDGRSGGRMDGPTDGRLGEWIDGWR